MRYINDKYIDLIRPEWKESYIRFIDGKFKLNPFSSHQPVLIHALNTITEGKVLEYGMGWHSTPIAHTICAMQDRELLSVETNPVWFKKFTQYKSDKHKLLLILPDEFRKLEHPFLEDHYSVAFVDGAPGDMRREVVLRLRDKADYIVVHDTEEWVRKFRYPKFTYNWDFSGFKYRFHLSLGDPNSSLLSNLDEVNENIIKFFDD